MSNIFQIRYGANANLPTLNAREFGWSTDSKQLYIGDGAANHEVLLDHKLQGDLDTNVKNVTFSYTLSSNLTWNGLASSVTVGESVSFPQILAFDISTGEWMLADADALATMPAMCMALESKTDGQACKVLLWGFVRYDTWNWTVGGLIYVTVTGTTGNTLSQTAPSAGGEQVQIVGYAVTADIMYFSPNVMLIEIAA